MKMFLGFIFAIIILGLIRGYSGMSAGVIESFVYFTFVGNVFVFLFMITFPVAMGCLYVFIRDRRNISQDPLFFIIILFVICYCFFECADYFYTKARGGESKRPTIEEKYKRTRLEEEYDKKLYMMKKEAHEQEVILREELEYKLKKLPERY